MRLLPFPSSLRRGQAALSLIEVMIAMSIFFMAVFAILGMVSNTLRNARALQDTQEDPAGTLASFLSLSNRLDEGTYSGDFGDLHPDYEYAYEVVPITNTLVRVDLGVVGGKGKTPTEMRMTIFLMPPNQPVNAGIGLRP